MILERSSKLVVQPTQLIEQGYAKSSIFHVAKKLKDLQLGILTSPVLKFLKFIGYWRDIIKLQKEITELEAAKEKMPDRLAIFEKPLNELRSLVDDAVG